MAAEPVIRLEAVSKSYRMGSEELRVLDQVSLEVTAGEFVAVLGPSGSGKTTLMNIIGCIDVADSGSYHLGGQDIRANNEDELAEVRNRKIGFIFQRFNLLPKYTALHNVAFPLLLRGMDRKEAYRIAEERLTAVGLGDRTGHKPSELSGGQQQRVSVARALSGNPEILLADEPTGALDSKTGDEILKLFKALKNQGNTILMITHDMDIAAHADRVIRIMDGKITASAASAESVESAESTESTESIERIESKESTK